jgi:hypothetical protein
MERQAVANSLRPVAPADDPNAELREQSMRFIARDFITRRADGLLDALVLSGTSYRAP